MLRSIPATAARRRFGADLTLPTEGRPATQVAAGSLENPKDRIFGEKSGIQGAWVQNSARRALAEAAAALQTELGSLFKQGLERLDRTAGEQERD